MQPPETAEGMLIAAEAARYLSAVAVFRGEGHEPHWEAEGIRSSAPWQPSRPAPRVAAPSTERSERC
jgi:hypothetical protein